MGGSARSRAGPPPAEAPTSKRLRADTAARQADRKHKTVHVVKSRLGTFLTPLGFHLDFEGVLKEANRAAFHAHLLANLHVAKLCADQKPCPKLDQTFYYRCFSAISVSSVRKKPDCRDADLAASAVIYKSAWPADYQPVDSYWLHGVFQNMSQQMAENARVSTRMAFWRRLMRYVQGQLDCLARDAWRVVDHVRADAYLGNDPLILRLRASVRLHWGDLTPASGDWAESPDKVMHLQFELLEHAEGQLSKGSTSRCHRLFSLLPTKGSFTTQHIKVDTTTLYGICKRSPAVVQQVPLPSEKEFLVEEDRAFWWSKFFQLGKINRLRKQMGFGWEIVTDGYAAGVTLWGEKPVPPKARKPPKPNPIDYAQVIGVDPGYIDLYTTSTSPTYQAADKKSLDSKHYSAKQYKAEAFHGKSERKIMRWQRSNFFYRTIIENMPCSVKTSNWNQILIYVAYFTSSMGAICRLDWLINFHWRKDYRGLKFRRFVGGQMATACMVKQLLGSPARKTLFGWGDGCRGASSFIKGHQRGPTRKLERVLQQHTDCTVWPVHEFRTSKVCAECHHFVKAMLNQDGSQVYSVRLCSNTACNARVNRDVNAARNMLVLLLADLAGEDRPAIFTRQGQG